MMHEIKKEKRSKLQSPLWSWRTKVGSWTWCLHTAHQACGQSWISALPPNAGPSLPSPHLVHQISHVCPYTPPTPQEQTRELVTCLTPCCTQSPNKTLSEFPVWPLINVYWLRIPRTLVGIIPFRLCTLLGQHPPPFPPSPLPVF